MNILGATDQVLLNLDTNQQQLGKITSQLSSGLRIQTAVDDPSGNAIVQTLQTKINGLQQSVENVQEGTNLLTVADGAAATIQDILQRINSLIVESNSDINSDSNLEDIQNEINQQLLEINRISQNANFNGVTLFDGSHDTYVAPPHPNVSYVEINPGLLPNGSTPTSASVSDPQIATNTSSQAGTAKLIQPIVSAIEDPSSPLVTGLMIFQITAAGNNLVDPQAGVVPGSDFVLNQILYSDDTSFAAGKGSESIFYNVFNTGLGFNLGSGGSVSEQVPSGVNSINLNIPNVDAADVGVAMGIEIIGPQASGGGTALTINDGGTEGATTSISLPTLSTNALQISDITVLRPTQVDDSLDANQGNPTGVDESNQYAAMNAQLLVGNALQNVSSLRAYLGAQMVSTSEDANNDQIAGINYTSSASNIADLNVGTATTELTKTQILVNVGTAVLSQMEISARALTSIMIGAL
jgi:flagellin-like hook-associated protein FlgL